MTKRRRPVAWIFLGFGFALLGCAAQAPPPYAFENVWTKPHANWRKYTEIAVRPVDVAELIDDPDSARIDAPAAQALGAYMEQALKEALRRYPRSRLQLVDTPGPNTVIVDAALIGLVSRHDHLGSSASGTAAPSPGIERIGMEAELRDGASGEVIAAIGDRESEPRAAADSPPGTTSAGAEPIVSEWALQIAGLVNSRQLYPPKHAVYHPWPAIMSWGH